MSQELRCRPSSLLGIQDPLLCFYVDRATWTFASTIRTEMDAAVTRLPKNAKEATHRRVQQKVLDQYLGHEREVTTRFKAPSTTR